MKRIEAIIDGWCWWRTRTTRARPVPPDVVLRGFGARMTRAWFRRTIARALAPSPRGFVRDDLLHLTALSAQLSVEWRTRDIHPWDRQLPRARQTELFREQAVLDTDEAITRFFRLLPDLRAVDVRVLEPYPPSRLLFAGRVSREDAVATRALPSPMMRLRTMGIRCRLSDGRLEPLEP